jgi:hypothetical protein
VEKWEIRGERVEQAQRKKGPCNAQKKKEKKNQKPKANNYAIQPCRACPGPSCLKSFPFSTAFPASESATASSI